VVTDVLDLMVVEFRIHGQREDALAESLGLRQRPVFESQFRLVMERYGPGNQCFDPVVGQVPAELVARVGRHNIILEDVEAETILVRSTGDFQLRQLTQTVLVDVGDRPSTVDPARKLGEAPIEDGRLDIVEPAVVAPLCDG
jgi:hypothetical protein